MLLADLLVSKFGIGPEKRIEPAPDCIKALLNVEPTDEGLGYERIRQSYPMCHRGPNLENVG